MTNTNLLHVPTNGVSSSKSFSDQRRTALIRILEFFFLEFSYFNHSIDGDAYLD